MSAEKVKRYGMRTPRAVSMFGTEWQISIGMQQQSEGEYVFAADYDALEKERDSLRAALREARSNLRHAEHCNSNRPMVPPQGFMRSACDCGCDYARNVATAALKENT